MPAELVVDPRTVLAVVVATAVIHLALVVLLRMSGQRSLAAMSTPDVACVIALGAVVGRTTLLAEPTLATGIIALIVLFTMQRLLGMLLRHPRFAAVLTPRPVLLMLDGRLDARALRANRLTEDDLRQRLRVAGIAHRDAVRCVVLERNGCISVVRAETEVDAWITQDLIAVCGVSPQRRARRRRPQDLEVSHEDRHRGHR